MFEYRIDPVAQIELGQAGDAYVSWFAQFGDMEKGLRRANEFFHDYRSAIERVKEHPQCHAKCSVYPFDTIVTEYRTFTVGWFTVFYTVDDGYFTVWHVRPSRSDFGNVPLR